MFIFYPCKKKVQYTFFFLNELSEVETLLEGSCTFFLAYQPFYKPVQLLLLMGTWLFPCKIKFNQVISAVKPIICLADDYEGLLKARVLPELLTPKQKLTPKNNKVCILQIEAMNNNMANIVPE